MTFIKRYLPNESFKAHNLLFLEPPPLALAGILSFTPHITVVFFLHITYFMSSMFAEGILLVCGTLSLVLVEQGQVEENTT